MLFFTPLRFVKKSTGLFAPLMQGPRQSRPSLAGPVTFLAASPSDKWGPGSNGTENRYKGCQPKTCNFTR